MAIATLVDIINLLKVDGTDSLINLNELQRAVGRNSTDIAEVKTTLNQTRGELATVNSTAQSALAQAALNSRALQETNTTVSNLQTKVSASLSQNTAAIQALITKVASLERSLAGLDGLPERVASLENNMAELGRRLTDCENKADQALTKGTALEETLGKFTSDVNAKFASLEAQMQTLSEHWLDLGTRVTNLESKVNQHGLTLSSNSTSLSTLVTKVNGLESNNTSVNNEIASIRNDMLNTNNSIESLASSHNSTQGNVATLLQKQSSIISAINLIKSDPVVRLSSTMSLDGNGFTRVNLQNYYNSNDTFSGALNDNVLGVIPYDIRMSSSSDQYRTLNGTWADFEGDSIINARVTNDLDGAVTGGCRVIMLTKSSAANVVI